MEQLPLQLSDASGVPFYRQIVDQIAQLIRSGRLGTGARLPSVRDLASQLLVSLITTRRAYADLEHAGLIVRRQGHGTFVAEEIEMPNHDQVVEHIRHQLVQIVGHGLRDGLSEIELKAMFELALENGRTDDTE